MIPRYPNRASEAKIKKMIQGSLVPLIDQTRRDRRSLTETFLRYDNIWKGIPDQASYEGRLGVYLPVGRRVLENWVTKLKQDLFPASGRWLSVRADQMGGEADEAALRSLLYKFVKQARLRRHATPWLRTLVTLGTAPVEVGWKRIEEVMPMMRKVAGSHGKKSEPSLEDVVRYLGPTERLVSPYRWYVYPTSVVDIEDATIVFEDILLDQATLTSLSKQWICPEEHDLGHHVENLKGALEMVQLTTSDASAATDRFHALDKQLRQRGFQSPTKAIPDAYQPIPCTVGYFRTALEEEHDEEDAAVVPRWYKFLLAGDGNPLAFRRNPLWDAETSYLAGKFVEVEDEFYGYGLPGVFDSLQYMLNDVMNQGSDSLVWSLNPIAGVDPTMVQDPTSIRMKPGAKWLVRNPSQSIQFIEPPKEAATAAFSAVSQVMALINDAANVAPFSGVSSPRARGRAVQTLGGLQMMASESLVQISDVLQGIEDLVYAPRLKKYHGLIMQCLDEPVLVVHEGARGASLQQRLVTREDVLGDYTLDWLASVTQYNLQVRGQQMISALQVFLRTPPGMLEQHNARLALPRLYRELWSEGLQLPEADRIIEDIVPVRSLAPELEHELYMAGRGDEVRVSPGDDDAKHLEAHQAFGQQMQQGGITDPDTAEMSLQLAQHVMQHISAQVAKVVMKQQQAMQQQGGMGMPGGLGMGQNGGRGPGGGLPAMPDAPGRPAATAGMDDLMRRMPRAGSNAMPGGSPGGMLG